MKKIVVILLLLVLIANISYRLDLTRSPHELVGELMYFPSGVALHALSMGFYALVADLVWLRFIQYYGEHKLTDLKFDMMHHILDVLTTLDHRFEYAYSLGGLMLTHDADRPDQARALMLKGMRLNPHDWRIPFMYGFVHYVFLKDYDVAHTFFRLASTKPNAPDIPKRWAAFTLHKKVGDLERSLSLWTDLYRNTANELEKEVALMYIQDIQMELDIRFLDTRIATFREKLGRAPVDLRELVAFRFLDALPIEPHGEQYIIRQGRAASTFHREYTTQ
jgi:hypothetical protein